MLSDFPSFYEKYRGNTSISLAFEKNVQTPSPHRTESERLERLLYEQKIDSLAQQQLEREKFNMELLLRLDSEAEERCSATIILSDWRQL